MEPTSWPVNWLVAVAVGFLVGGLGGFLLARRGQGAVRVRELEQQLEASRDELSQYREEVSKHFTKTSDLLRRMTLQYRAVYEHLAEGARGLCPEGAAAIEEKISEPTLPLEERAGDRPGPGAEGRNEPRSKPGAAGRTAAAGAPAFAPGTDGGDEARSTLGPDEILDEELPPAKAGDVPREHPAPLSGSGPASSSPS